MYVCLCAYGKEKETIVLFFESARAIFRDKKQCIFSARIEFVEFALTIEHPVIRNGTFDGTNVRIATRWRKVGAAFHKQVPSHQPLNKATVNTKKRRHC